MKADTLMVLWHSKEPVFSVDFHASGRLASSGADNDIKIWKVGKRADGGASLDFLASLTRHTKAVNVVRFSPDGNFLASGSDDGYIFIWKLNTAIPVLPDSIDKEVWSVTYTLRGKAQDVYDLAWSPDSSQIIVGSTDNSASIWSVKAAQCKHHFEHHSHYVQGVAWDPLGLYLLTFSSDRTLRAYTRKVPKNKKPQKSIAPPPSVPTPPPSSDQPQDPPTTSPPSPSHATPVTPATPSKKRGSKEKWIVAHLVNKREFPGTSGLLDTEKESEKEKEKEKEKEESGKGKDKEKEKDCLQHKLFLDESVNTFFRRLTWSPEGSLLFLPTGIFKATPASPPMNVCYVFSRNNLNRPLFYIPSGKPVISVRCNPILFKLTDGNQAKPSSITSPTETSDLSDSSAPASPASSPSSSPAHPFIKLDYRIVFAIATVDSVVVYDTQHLHPLAFLGDMHYANMTDLCWSADGLSLMMSSTDGYCSFATFSAGELGVPLEENEMPSAMKEAVMKRQQVEEEEEEPSNHPISNAAPADPPSNEPATDEGAFFERKRKEITPNTSQDPVAASKPAEKKPRRLAPTFIAPLPANK